MCIRDSRQGKSAAGKLIRNRIRAVFSAKLYQPAVGNRIVVSFTLEVDGSVVLERDGSFRAVPCASQGSLRFSYHPVRSLCGKAGIGQTHEQKRNKHQKTAEEKHLSLIHISEP